VHLTGDGLALEPAELAQALVDLCAAERPVEDEYALGGYVEEFENYFAKLLGKERALFMPTGTLANHLALRALARDHRRVIVQEMSHIYNDTGDGSQILSGLTLIPLAPSQATFTWRSVEQAIGRATTGRVPNRVGAISIESPVRRLLGEQYDRAEMARVCAEARRLGIGLHLDGARLFIASAYSGVSPAEYAMPFDTVYVSLWKYFNSLNGAVLAGPASVLDGMFHTRRMFGGAVWSAWPFAMLARRHADGFIDRFRSAIKVSEEFIRGCPPNIRIERIPNGTNIFKLIITDTSATVFRERLGAQGIRAPEPLLRSGSAIFTLSVNETWNRLSGEQLVQHFKHALES
jgi:threonine aldolase